MILHIISPSPYVLAPSQFPSAHVAVCLQIVQTALPHLFRALSTHTNLTHLTLTHLAFPRTELPLPTLPSLRTLHLGQITFLPPSSVTDLVLSPSSASLECVRLVDAYKESIWGPRIRRSDIEATARTHAWFDLAEDGDDHKVERVRRIVVCEAQTERIMGGDRVTDPILL